MNRQSRGALPVVVPENVVDTLTRLRKDKTINPLDRRAAIEYLFECGENQAAWWVETNADKYLQGSWVGFQASLELIEKVN